MVSGGRARLRQLHGTEWIERLTARRDAGLSEGYLSLKSKPGLHWSPGFLLCLGWKLGPGCSMLVASLKTKANNRGRKNHETQRFHQGHRIGRCGCSDDRGAGNRAVDAGDQMATDGELAEVARYALWRRRIDGKSRRRS